MGLLDADRELSAVVDRLRPSVVRIDRWEGRRGTGSPPVASGTGLIVDPQGLVVTNDHVVRGAGRIEASLSDGQTLSAGLVGEDRLTDLALLRLEEPVPSPAALGDSTSLRAGQLVLAIGNALGLPGEPTVSLGVVSALHRPLPGAEFVFEGLLQTDAAINPGNSGGPLVTMSGEVVGVTTAIVPFAQGVGFAVPSLTVQRIVRQIRSHGRVVRPWLGVSVAPIGATGPREGGRRPGLAVAEVVPRGPADLAGLQGGDVLFRVGSAGLRTVKDLLVALSDLAVGSWTEVGFARRGTERAVRVRVGESPSPAGS